MTVSEVGMALKRWHIASASEVQELLIGSRKYVEITYTQFKLLKPTSKYIHAYLGIESNAIHFYMIDSSNDLSLQDVEWAIESGEVQKFRWKESHVQNLSIKNAKARKNLWDKFGLEWLEAQQTYFQVIRIPTENFTKAFKSSQQSLCFAFWGLVEEHPSIRFSPENYQIDLMVSDKLSLEPNTIVSDLTRPAPPFGQGMPQSNYQMLDLITVFS